MAAKKKNKKDRAEEEDIIFEDGVSDEATSSEDVVPEDDPRALLKKVTKLKKKLLEAERTKEEYLDGWQRSRAEYARLKQESEAAQKESGVRAKRAALLEFLPVADSFDMAFANEEAWKSVDENWRMGVEYIHQQLHSALLREDISQFDALGEEFDPVRHEPLDTVPVTDEAEDHQVVEVIQRGYLVGAEVLRPAKVKVGKYTEKEETGEKNCGK